MQDGRGASTSSVYAHLKILEEKGYIAMDVLSDMDELQIRQCLAMMKAMKSVSVGK